MDHRIRLRRRESGARRRRTLVPEEGLEPSWSQGPRDFESRASANSATPASPRDQRRTGARKHSLLTARGQNTPHRVHDQQLTRCQVFGCWVPSPGLAARIATRSTPPSFGGRGNPSPPLRRDAPPVDAEQRAPPTANNPFSRVSPTLKEGRAPAAVPAHNVAAGEYGIMSGSYTTMPPGRRR